MRIVLVTGSNSGFGAACVREFAQAGDTVVATVRDPAAQAAEKLANLERVEIRPLDVSDDVSINACIEAVLADHGRIDVLVNSAGIHLLAAMEDMKEQDLRRTFETNFFGPIKLSRAVLPSMRERRRGHLITITSIGAQVGRAIDGAYCASKAATEIAMEALRAEAARFGIRVSVLAPGAYRTGIARRFEAEPASGSASPYRDLQAFRYEKVRESVAAGGDPDEVAMAVKALADDPHPPFRRVVGDRALEMEQALAGLDDRQREELITRLAGIDWWVSGASAPQEGKNTDPDPP